MWHGYWRSLPQQSRPYVNETHEHYHSSNFSLVSFLFLLHVGRFTIYSQQHKSWHMSHVVSLSTLGATIFGRTRKF